MHRTVRLPCKPVIPLSSFNRIFLGWFDPVNSICNHHNEPFYAEPKTLVQTHRWCCPRAMTCTCTCTRPMGTWSRHSQAMSPGCSPWQPTLAECTLPPAPATAESSCGISHSVRASWRLLNIKIKSGLSRSTRTAVNWLRAAMTVSSRRTTSCRSLSMLAVASSSLASTVPKYHHHRVPKRSRLETQLRKARTCCWLHAAVMVSSRRTPSSHLLRISFR